MSAVVIIYSIETVQILLAPIMMEYYRARIHCERKTKPEGVNFQVIATFKQKIGLNTLHTRLI